MAGKNYGYDSGKVPVYTEELCRLLRLKATPTGIKLYKRVEDMLAVPKIRTPKEGEILTACQLIGQATRLNFTVGFTKACLPAIQCAGVCRFAPKEVYLNSAHMAVSWYASEADALKHQKAMYCLPEDYAAVAASPLASGRLGEPDVCLVYGTPQQVMFICCGLQFDDFEVVESSFVGETSCSDSWVRALVTQKPCYTMPCFGERRFGGVLDDEMVMAFQPRHLPKILDGLNKLAGRGLRYPASFYGIQHDVRAGLGVSYDLDAMRKKSGGG